MHLSMHPSMDLCIHPTLLLSLEMQLEMQLEMETELPKSVAAKVRYKFTTIGEHRYGASLGSRQVKIRSKCGQS